MIINVVDYFQVTRFQLLEISGRQVRVVQNIASIQSCFIPECSFIKQIIRLRSSYFITFITPRQERVNKADETSFH